MKKIIFVLSVALGTMTFSSCKTEEALTPNPDLIEGATGDNPTGTNNGGGTTTNDSTGTGGGTGGGGGSSVTLPSDFRASTTLSKRAALLEDFTGVRCGFCPDGHVRAEAAKSSLGVDKFIIMAVHAGSYAAPATGWANFTTAYGAALVTQAKVSGYPAGTISRIKADDLGVTPQQAGGYAMSRGSWQSAGAAVNNIDAPLNIGVDASISASNELTVDVDIYYTQTQTGTQKINVALIQDGLVSRQSGAPNGGTAYAQNNVLRDFVTGQWGETITESTDSADFVRKTFTYSVPADYHGTTTEGGGAVVKSDLKVIVFVTDGNTDVLNVVEEDVQ